MFINVNIKNSQKDGILTVNSHCFSSFLLFFFSSLDGLMDSYEQYFYNMHLIEGKR